MIEIQGIKGLGHEDLINLLLEQTKPFDIYIPKESQKYFSEREAISTDYANLAYAGQQLYEIARTFKYDEVAPEDHESVLFEIETDDIENLARVLLDISYGYVNDHDDEHMGHYM